MAELNGMIYTKDLICHIEQCAERTSLMLFRASMQNGSHMHNNTALLWSNYILKITFLFPPPGTGNLTGKVCVCIDLLGFTSNLATCLSVTEQTLIKDGTHICPFCIAAHLAHRLTELLDFVPAISEQRCGKLELVPNKFLSISWTMTETISYFNWLS